MASPPNTMEDQGRLLEDALLVVRTQSQLMTRFLDQPVRFSAACFAMREPNQTHLI
jgi:hypothetical protein